MNTNILSILTGLTDINISKVIKQGWHGGRPFVTGCLINTDNVYSVCQGVVIGIGKDDNNLYSVTVEYNSQLWVRYCLLKSYSISIGERVLLNTKIGNAYKNTLRFEYCTANKSDFPIRVLNRQLYKHDPAPVLFGQELLTEVF